MADYRLTSSGGRFPLVQGENIIGSFKHCHVVLEGEGIAGEHARLDVSPGEVTLVDLGSEAGTFADDVQVRGSIPLTPGQTLKIGSATLRLERQTQVRAPLRLGILRWAPPGATRIALGILGALLIGYLILRIMYSEARSRLVLIEAVDDYLGRDAEVGSVDMGLFGGHVTYNDVVIQDLPEFSGEPFIQASSIDIEYESGRYLGVFSESLSADITLDRPIVLLERTERGSWNVGDLARLLTRKILDAGTDFRGQLDYASLEIHIVAVDAILRLRDDLTGRNEEITGVSFEAHVPALDKPVTYSLTMSVPVAGHPGRVSVSGEAQLFAGSTVSSESVNGDLLKLEIVELDTRAIPGLQELLGRLPGRRPSSYALTTQLDVKAETLKSVTASGRCLLAAATAGRSVRSGKGMGPGRIDGNMSLTFEAVTNLVDRHVERAECSLRGGDLSVDAQGRLIPAERGAEVLDIDATVKATAGPVMAALGLDGEFEQKLDGDVNLRIATTGPTDKLLVDLQLKADGLACAGVGLPPENIDISTHLTVGLDGWSSLESVSVRGVTAEASWLHAALGPGKVMGLTDPATSSGKLGLLEVELDLGDFGRRYRPLLPFVLPDTRIHAWAEAAGKDGRFDSRYVISSSNEVSLEGKLGLRLDEEELPRLQIEMGLTDADAMEIKAQGDIGLSWPEPGIDLSVSASGELSEVLEVIRPYLKAAGSVWARGRFTLSDARIIGTPRRFSTRGKLELLEPELWGGLPTALPFSEPRFDAIWNVEFDLAATPATLKANVLKGASSLLQFRLEGMVRDIARGLGRYDLQAFADLDRVGAILKKLGLASPSADIRGSVNLELSADTARGDVKLRKLAIDTPWLEADGGGELHLVPLGLLTGTSSLTEGKNATGNLRLAARLNISEAIELAPQLVPGYFRLSDPDIDGSIKLDLSADGSGSELVLAGNLDLDDFVGRLGRHVRKTASELASLRFSVAVSSESPKLVTLRSGILTLGGASKPAKLELSGELDRDLTRFALGVRSDLFPVAPITALGEDLAPGCTGEAELDLKLAGSLKNWEVRPADLEIDGRLVLRDAELLWRDFPSLRTRLNGAVGLKGRTLDAKDVKLEILAHSDLLAMSASAGTVSFKALELDFGAGPRPTGRFAAQTDRLSIDMLVAALRTPPGTGTAEAIDIASDWPIDTDLRGSITVGSATAFGRRLLFNDLGADIGVSRGQLSVSGVRGSIWGGKLTGKALIDLAGSGVIASGRLSAKDVDLERVSKSLSIPGALTGKLAGTSTWSGSGMTVEEFERNWSFDIEGESGEIVLTASRFPFAHAVRKALSRVFKGKLPGGPSTSKPVTVRLALRRGRLTLDDVAFEFDNGLRLKLQGRTELDGRVAGWVSVEELPKGRKAVDPSLRPALQELVARSALRFAVTGTWAAPTVDVKGLLWMLQDTRKKNGDEPAEENAEPDAVE